MCSSTENYVSSISKRAPIVSVIMNCYNCEKYLKEAVDSVLAQTYHSWEIIFWDNSSTDSSAEIYLSYDDDRLKYYHSPVHVPLYEARNYAVEKSEGDFIAFLDTDDIWLPVKLEQQLPLFSDPEVGLVYSNYAWKNEIRGISYKAHKDFLPSGFVLTDILYDYMIGLLTIMVRKDAYESMHSKFNPLYNIIGDFDFAVRLSVDWKFAAVQSVTAYCRWHGDNLQIIEQDKKLNELENWLAAITIKQNISSHPEFNAFKNRIKKTRSIYEAKKGNYKVAIKNIFIVSGVLNKIKIITAIVLPVKLLDWIIE